MPHPIKRIHKEAAMSKVCMKIRRFLEINPGFEGEININIIRFHDDDYATADKEKLDKLALNAKCLKALKNEKVQASARRRVLEHYIRVKKVAFHITDVHVYAHIKSIKIK